MKISVKIYRLILAILLVCVITVVIVVVGFVGLQMFGKNSLYGNRKEKPTLITLEDLAEPIQELEVQKSEPEWQEGDVRYQGNIYRYNEEILTFLFLGIDKMTEVKPVENGLDGGQSDAIFLLVLNPKSKEISIIAIPRDTMTQIQVYNEEGDYIGTANGQLTLQHGYGDGAVISCERTSQAVSQLFYNLPIHGYCAVNMGAIPLLNDVVGGVEVVALETVKEKDFYVEEGETIHLDDMEAYYYLKKRDTKSAGSAGRRLERQKQYLTAYADAVKETMKQDLTLPLKLYETLSKYMVTNLTIDEVTYLAGQAAGYHFNSKNVYSLTGETVTRGKFEEFYIDETALYELIVKVFYEKVES